MKNKRLKNKRKRLKVIMLTVFFIVMLTPHMTYAQQNNLQKTVVSLQIKDLSLVEAIREVEKACEYSFFYDANKLDLSTRVSLNATNKPLGQVLNAILEPANITYEISNNQIVLIPPQNVSESKSIPSPKAIQQKRSISGVVRDASGEPVIGANILEKGTTNGVISDLDGKFTLNVPSSEIVLQISYIGYITKEVTVGSEESHINIVLEENAKALDEIVVVGYGTVKKRDLTGSVSSVKSGDIQRSASTSLDQAIQGKAAGVQVTQASSAPGGQVSVRIRGGNSLSSSNEPLYVVDGFPVSAGSSAGGSGIGQNPLATINTADIESMEILKDASATAIYGARGANGVVLITTKRGNVGKPIVTFDAYYGVQRVSKKLDMMNAKEYAILVNEARANDNQPVVFPTKTNLYYFPDIKSLGDGVDYQDEVFVNAPVSNYNIGIAGGTEAIKYSVGGGYFGQHGVIKNTDFNRASFRANLDIKIIPTLHVAANTSASHSWANGTRSEGSGGGGKGDIVWGTILMPPTVPIYDEKGNYTMTNPTPGGTPTENPVAIANHFSDKQEIDRFLGSVDANWEIMKNLKLKVSFGVDMSSSNRAYYWPKETFLGFSQNGAAHQANRKEASYLNENTLSYSNVFGNHAINGLLGYTRQVFHSKYFFAGSSDYSTDLYLADNLGAGTTYTAPGSYQEQSQLASYLGRLNYIYKDRYLFTFTARADGSSKFGENNKWAFFPSVAFAWRLSEEEYMKDVDWLANLKLRASYGKTGNQNIRNYQSLVMLKTMNYPIGDNLSSGVGPNNMPNPNLKWETTATSDLGLDIGLFNNRLTVVADYYYKKTTDLLWGISIPSSSGFTNIFKNIGSLENKGVELAVGAEIFTDEFKWNTQINWSRNRNKVLEIPGYSPTNQGQISGHLKVSGSWLEPGLPVGVWNLLKYDGVFQDQAQLDAGPHSTANDRLGDARFVDKNGDGKIVFSDDRMIVGDPNPDFIYGWTNNFSFKGFDFSIYIQGSHGNDIINVQRAETNISGPWGNQRREILNRWTPTNTNTNVSRARVTVDPLLLQSDWLIEDGSYLRIKTMSFGYTFKKIRFMNSLRVYVSGQNLFTFTNYSGFDPEVNSPGNSNLQIGVDYNAYPASKAVLFGLSATF